MELPVPFRWNVKKREQLGRLITEPGEEVRNYWQRMERHVEDMQTCGARVLSLCQDASLVFVGRSPEPLFDYLSGLFEDSSWADRLVLLPLSARGLNTAYIRERYPPSALEGLRASLDHHGLSPAKIAVNAHPYALVDVVCAGSTMRSVVDFLSRWAEESYPDPAAVIRKLRIVGLTVRRKTSPNAWRWQQQAPWLEAYPADFVKNVSLDWSFWDLLGNTHIKASPSFSPRRWGTDALSSPSRDRSHKNGLYVAWRLLELGRSSAHRRAFAKAMARERGMRFSWYRSLAGELSRSG